MAEGMEASRAKEALLDVTSEVRAAGGVVRRREDGRVHTVLVHRPRYDDWTLPKGKLLDGESFEEAATREVREETGLECRIDGELPASRYTDQHGASKVVRYWLMEALDGHDLHPTDEVDEARWFTISEARDVLTYDRDRAVLDCGDHGRCSRVPHPSCEGGRSEHVVGRRSLETALQDRAPPGQGARACAVEQGDRADLEQSGGSVRGDGGTARRATGAPDRAPRRAAGRSTARRPARVARRAPVDAVGSVRPWRPDPGCHRASRGAGHGRRIGAWLEEGISLGVGTRGRPRRACDVRPAATRRPQASCSRSGVRGQAPGFLSRDPP